MARPSPLEFPSQQCRCQKRHPLILASVKAVVLVDCSSGGDRVSERNGKKSGRNSTPLYTLTQRFCQILRPENNLLHSDSAGMLDGAQKPTLTRRAMPDALEPTYKCTRPVSHEQKKAGVTKKFTVIYSGPWSGPSPYGIVFCCFSRRTDTDR